MSPGLLLFLALLWAGNARLVVSERTVPVLGASPRAQLTIAQLSDIHGRRFGRGGNRLLRKLGRHAPDIVVVTGDLVSIGQGRWDQTVRMLARVAARYPVLYVRGNHERMRADCSEIEAALRDSGIVVLTEERYDFERNGLRVAFLGMPDLDSYGSSLHRFALAARKLAGGAADAPVRVLLSHRPELVGVYASLGVDVVLAGHAHGGQVRWPGGGGLYAPDQGLFPRYTGGAYLLSDPEGRRTTLIVSRGAGGNPLLPRIFNPPEVVLVRLTAGSASASRAQR